jgi:competence protein ComEC
MQARDRQAGAVPAAGAAPLAGLALGWLLGVSLQLQQADLWPQRWLFAWCVAPLLLGAAARFWFRGVPAVLAWTLAAAILGFASTSLRAAWRLDDALRPALEGPDIEVTGVIAEMPRLGAQGPRFVFDTETARLAGSAGTAVRLPRRLSLGWYRSADDETVLAAPGEDLRAGQRWRFTVRLRAPHGNLNPHGFDLELWLFEQGIAGTGSVRARPETPAIKLAEAAGHPVERLRQTVRDAILARVADPAAAGVLAALAIGDQAAIDRPGWDLFRITGVAHLMSISGLHVTLFAWLVGGLLRRLWRLRASWMLACPTPTAARWGGWAAAAAYALLAGWGVPAQRTVWMIGVVVLLRSVGLRWPLHAVLLAAAFAVSLFDPWALMQPGFWLSYGAVALLVASEPVQGAAARVAAGWRVRVWREAHAGLRSQAVATIGLAPLSLVFFQQISLVGYAANLVAIPLVTLLITPLALLGVLLPPLWTVAAWLVQGLSAYLQALASAPAVVWSAAAAPGWAIAAGVLAALLAVLPWPWRLRSLALPLMLPLLWPHVDRPAEGQFELVAADIGQGTAALVRTRGHLLVFDTGPQTSPDVDAGSRVLVPLLRARGEARIDLLMLSHRDADHVGGAPAILAAVPVAAMASSLTADHPVLAAAQHLGVPHRLCTAGQVWDWDGVHFAVLQPVAEDHGRGLKPNALSCVLRVQAASGRSALLTGDIEAAQEIALLQRLGTALRSDVLLVPHHGSRTSSTAAFIDGVSPEVAVVQAAYRSRYGHPAPDVMQRYADRGVAIVRSDRCGAWTQPAAGAAHCERLSARRYWHHRVDGTPLTAP